MPVNLNNTAPINPDDAAFDAMLTNLQGNILKGHGRDHTVHIFFQLTGTATTFRPKLIALAGRLVTSAKQQHIETKQFKDFGVPGQMFGNLFFTARGYSKLGFSAAQITAGFPEAGGTQFRDGMAAHGMQFNDPAPATWDTGYQGNLIDGMLLIADDDLGFLLRQARTILNEMAAFSTILAVERGNALRNEDGEGIEHFGYVDGRSQPLYFTTDIANDGNTDKWNPFAPLSLALVPDGSLPKTGAGAVADAFGSYFVFRKLEQDVLHFKLREQDLADTLGLVGSDRERAGAMAVGRFEDGTPLALSQTDGFIPSKENNFQYDIDPNGLKCPFQAHIRKANPRGDIVRKLVPGGDVEQVERRHRITRRGITYGTRERHPNALASLDEIPTGEVGLLFMCFQSSIADQFAFMQQSWVNNESFVVPGAGLDPVIGQKPATPAPIPQKWTAPWGTAAPAKSFSFGQFITLKGGEYFFAPSIPFLKKLAP